MTVLQCPGCGHIHGEGEHGAGRTFRCRGCRRLLSVPVAVAAAESSQDDTGDSGLPWFTVGTAAPERPGPPHRPGPTHRPGRPAVPGQPPRPWDDDPGDRSDPGLEIEAPPADARAAAAPAEEAPRSRRTPVWLRALVWTVALAVGLVVTAVALRAVGVLDVDTVIDTYAERGFRRYTTLLILVPVWAATASALAHLALEWVARRRRAR